MDIRFIQSAKEKDLIKVRFFLSNELMLDPRGVTFNEMREFAESHMPDLYEEDDGEEYVIYIADKSQWDSNYLYRVKNALDFNFSRKRLDYYEQVIKVVLKEKAKMLYKEEMNFGAKDMNAKDSVLPKESIIEKKEQIISYTKEKTKHLRKHLKDTFSKSKSKIESFKNRGRANENQSETTDGSQSQVNEIQTINL